MLLTTMQTDSIIHEQLWRIYNPTSHEENEYLVLFRICVITPSSSGCSSLSALVCHHSISAQF